MDYILIQSISQHIGFGISLVIILIIGLLLPVNQSLKAQSKFEKMLKDNHPEEWGKLMAPSERKWPYFDTLESRRHKYLAKKKYEHLNDKELNELGRKAYLASYYPFFGAVLSVVLVGFASHYLG